MFGQPIIPERKMFSVYYKTTYTCRNPDKITKPHRDSIIIFLLEVNIFDKNGQHFLKGMYTSYNHVSFH